MAFARELAASSNIDYFEKLVTFLSTDPTLVAASENWEVVTPPAKGIAEVAYEGVAPSAGKVEAVMDKNLSTYVNYLNLSGNQAGAVIVDFVIAMEVRGWSVNNGAPTSLFIDYWNGTTWVQVDSQTTTGGYDKFIFSSAGAWVRWRFRWNDLGGSTGTKYFRDWRFYTGAMGVEELPSSAISAALHGPGIVGYTRPYIELSLNQGTAGAYYNLLIRQGTYIGGVVGNLSQRTVTRLTNGAMTYWIVANGRRVVSGVSFGGIFESFYAGLLLPYSPAKYLPYPAFIGGTSPYTNPKKTYASTNPLIRSWFDPMPDMAFAFTSNSTWITLENWRDSTTRKYSPYSGTAAWDTSAAETGAISPQIGTNYSKINTNAYINPPGTDSTLFPLIPFFMDPQAPEIFGELEGCYWTPGRGMTSGDVITINSVDYVVFQAAHNTDFSAFFVLKME